MLEDMFAFITACQSNVCPQMIRDEDHPPRGFFTEARGPVPLMVVAKNPGPPLSSEIGIYRNMTHRQIAERHLRFAGDVFYGRLPALQAKRRIFHNQLKIYLRYILGIDTDPLPYGDYDPAGIWKKCVYTNLVMCSFRAKSNQRLPNVAMKACYERSFSRQLKFFKPKALLTLDKADVFHFLTRTEIKRQHGLPVFHIKHPSYFIGERRDELLAQIRIEIKRAIEGKTKHQKVSISDIVKEDRQVNRNLTRGQKSVFTYTTDPQPGRRAPIMAINVALIEGNVSRSMNIFKDLMQGEYNYVFTHSDPFVRQVVINIFNALVARTTDFQVYRGPRRLEGKTWHHPTFALSFNTIAGRHFCDFKPKVVGDGYFKMTFPLPRHDFYERLLRGFKLRQRNQSSGSYINVRLYPKVSPEDCDQLALTADTVRQYYS